MKKSKFPLTLPVSIMMAGGLIAAAVLYVNQPAAPAAPSQLSAAADAEAKALESEIFPADGLVLPIKLGDLGAQLVANGAIDQAKFEALYADQGNLAEAAKALLAGAQSEPVKMDHNNAGLLLNFFWAFGLANKNEILEAGPMSDPRYGGAGGFASTAGWTIAQGKAMDHYSRYALITLTPDQQKLVEAVSQNIYRPCCGNPTYFPDCNHGMAMLGLLELMAAQGADEETMYKTALAVNSYWFPDTYLTIAKYFKNKGTVWSAMSAKELLGYNYSSGRGYQNILTQVAPPTQSGGGSCGV